MDLQGDVCSALSSFDTNSFTVDRWKTSERTGGITCTMQEGSVFEKATVNVILTEGKLSDEAERALTERLRFPIFPSTGNTKAAWNPNVPTLHFLYRYVEVFNVNDSKKLWWFQGFTDLCPFKHDEEAFSHFHRALKRGLDKHDPSYYSRFKRWCDEIFTIKHRGETRGVGGIFFDHLDGPNQDDAFSVVKTCMHNILPAYEPLVQRHMNRSYSYADTQWQQMRRGRFVEFELMCDPLDVFGENERREASLAMLPLSARWERYVDPPSGSNHSRLLDILQHPRDWA